MSHVGWLFRDWDHLQACARPTSMGLPLRLSVTCIMWQENDGLIERWKRKDMENVVELHNKAPVWNEGMYCSLTACVCPFVCLSSALNLLGAVLSSSFGKTLPLILWVLLSQLHSKACSVTYDRRLWHSLHGNNSVLKNMVLNFLQ